MLAYKVFEFKKKIEMLSSSRGIVKKSDLYRPYFKYRFDRKICLFTVKGTVYMFNLISMFKILKTDYFKSNYMYILRSND